MPKTEWSPAAAERTVKEARAAFGGCNGELDSSAAHSVAANEQLLVRELRGFARSQLVPTDQERLALQVHRGALDNA